MSFLIIKAFISLPVVWWLILGIYLTALKDASIAGKIFLGVSAKLFLLRLAFEFIDQVKMGALISVGGHRPICWGPKMYKKMREDKFMLPTWAGTSIVSCSWTWELLIVKPLDSNQNLCYRSPGSRAFRYRTRTYTIGSPGSQAFSLGLGLHHCFSWPSSLWTVVHETSLPP